ncbi:MAG TPA: hypothetical protein VGH44_00110 [Candidatus Saccharimonadia bacterium]|jgi:hypothetical protein
MGKSYQVEARLDLPDYAAERRYIMMEIGLAQREMAKCPHWIPFSYPGLGILQRADWRRYIHELERYGRELDRNENEAREGLWPLVFMVVNDQPEPVANVRIRLQVEGGQVWPKHKPPTRPLRVDGAPEQSNTPRLLRARGFERRHIRVTAHVVEAEFSRLEAHDNARLLSQTLYVDARHGARIKFEIGSGSRSQQGEVRLPASPHVFLSQS